MKTTNIATFAPLTKGRLTPARLAAHIAECYPDRVGAHDPAALCYAARVVAKDVGVTPGELLAFVMHESSVLSGPRVFATNGVSGNGESACAGAAVVDSFASSYQSYFVALLRTGKAPSA